MHSLPVFLRLEGRPVILLGTGEAADAKRRLLARAGAAIVDEATDAALAIVAIEEQEPALAAVARLKARGVLVNAVDRPAHCDFTLPAIVDRSPVLIAVGTGGASAGLAKALRQRLEALLPASLGRLAEALHAARAELRARFPEAGQRRRAIDSALDLGGALDPLSGAGDVAAWLAEPDTRSGSGVERIRLRSADPDELTLREARLLARADVVRHAADVPPAILDRARADAVRMTAHGDHPGLVVEIGWGD
ncbi:NAD(P)-dependent oxidoreductase [Sphingomonas sp.]|uniref:precorrin-2 dehydrogenase/sirohydrochlorin ferrochelatase family protein n=1 Tax=Sphingomonas sp. TaxID=28214 RepID=UPI003B003A50